MNSPDYSNLDPRPEIAEPRPGAPAMLGSMQFLQSTLDALSAHIGILDEEGKIIAVNRAWSRFTLANRLSQAEYCLGANYLEVCEHASGECSAEASQVARGIREVIAGTASKFQLEYPCHSPEERRWFVVRVSRFESEGPATIVVAHENITARKKIEEELRDSEEKFHHLAENITDVFWITSPDLNAIHYVSAGYELIWGRSMESLYANAHQRIESIIPEDRDRVFAAFGSLAAEQSEITVEYRITRPDDSIRWVRDRGFQVRDAAGKLVRLTGIATDITERKQAEEALHRQQIELITASRQAGMAEVATSVLHNVGNVLNSVNISADLASGKIRGSCSADVTRIAALIQQHRGDLPDFLASAQGSQLPDFLTALSVHLNEDQRAVLAELESLGAHIDHIKKIVAMQQSYASAAGVIGQEAADSLVEDALRLSAAAIDRHGLSVVRKYEPTPPLEVDKHKVLQILVNLIRNAKYAMDEAGAHGKRMTLGINHHNGASVRISVSDEGVGIPAENLTLIFAHGFTTRVNGHGFGLHSAALAARDLGGSLIAHSDGPGKGAVFTLELPLPKLPKS